MKFLLKGLLIFAAVIGVLFASFSLYAHFLMDYSLDSLTIVAAATRENSRSDEKFSNASQNMYQGIIRDVAVEEASKDDADLQSLILLDLVSRSLDDAQYRTGYVRASNYLGSVMENKKPKNFFFRFMDSVLKSIANGYKSMMDFLKYSLGRGQKKEKKEGVSIELEDYASSLLLNQAQEKEQNGLLYQAEERYRKFIESYKNSPKRPMAVISLANVLIQERKFKEADAFLREVQPEFSGSEEGEIIDKLIRRLNVIGEKLKLIVKLKRQVLKEKDIVRRQTLFMKLGSAYVATYQFDKAESVFSKLKNSEDVDIRQKAGFYLGWIYKNNAQYDKSAQIFKRLLEDPELREASEYALRAQLADVYYKKGDAKQAAEFYKTVSLMEDPDRRGSSKKTGEAWASFSESELVNIYSFDLKDPREARQHMDKLMNLVGSSNSAQSLALTLEWAGKISLRDLAFQALVEKRLTRALDLFTKYLAQNTDDSLTLTGLATVYALMGDLDSAYAYALKGYERQASEYSMLMLGYIEGLRGNYAGSIERYRQALALQPNSSAAKFNLAYSYLRMKEFQTSLDVLIPLQKSIEGVEKEKFLLAKTLNNIGYCYWGMGQAPKDVEYFQKALQVNPGFDTAQKNLAELQRRAVPKPAQLLD